jgi:hypothetical protein
LRYWSLRETHLCFTSVPTNKTNSNLFMFTQCTRWKAKQRN